MHTDADGHSDANVDRSPDDHPDEAAHRVRRGEVIVGILLTVVGVIGTTSGALFVALASREPLDGATVPGGFATAIIVLLAGVAAIIIGSALRHSAPWARRLVMRR